MTTSHFSKCHLVRAASALIAILSLGGCDKKSGKAIVLEKEHIAIREAQPSPSPQRDDNTESRDTPDRQTDGAGEEVREMADNEISADGYVMKREMRGTSKDPRATDREQWIVRAQLNENGREIKVQTSQRQWEKLKVGDEVQVTYRQGKYTGTIWGSEIR